MNNFYRVEIFLTMIRGANEPNRDRTWSGSARLEKGKDRARLELEARRAQKFGLGSSLKTKYFGSARESSRTIRLEKARTNTQTKAQQTRVRNQHSPATTKGQQH